MCMHASVCVCDFAEPITKQIEGMNTQIADGTAAGHPRIKSPANWALGVQIAGAAVCDFTLQDVSDNTLRNQFADTHRSRMITERER
ncbi:hypothetical protein D3C84_1204800 [compost metagenome]